jgi:putative membrane protein
MKALLIAVSAAVLVSGCATMMNDELGADVEAEADPMGLPTQAPAYVEMVQSSDMFEIESSRLALQRSGDPAVRRFAQMMINDHSRMSGEMMNMARNMRLPMSPMQMMTRHAEMMERLSAASPAEFDMMYRREQLMAHEEALMLHRTYADRGDYQPLSALAARAVPAIEMHLAEAQRLPDQPMAPMMQDEPYGAPEPATTTRRRGERG